MTQPLTIIDAMDGEELFADWFRGNSWFGWRAILEHNPSMPI